MSVKSFSLATGLLISLAAARVGQAPLLQLSPPQLTSRGWQVTVSNSYGQAATAFILGMTSPERPLPKGFPLARHFEDAVPGSGGRPLGIAAGSSKVIRLGSSRFKQVAYRVEAVVYADGSSAGNPAEVQQILKIRRAELDDIRAVLPKLQQAQADPSLIADAPGLAQEFRRRAQAHEKAFSADNAGMHIHAGDYVCSLISANIERRLPRGYGWGTRFRHSRPS